MRWCEWKLQMSNRFHFFNHPICRTNHWLKFMQKPEQAKWFCCCCCFVAQCHHANILYIYKYPNICCCCQATIVLIISHFFFSYFNFRIISIERCILLRQLSSYVLYSSSFLVGFSSVFSALFSLVSYCNESPYTICMFCVQYPFAPLKYMVR